MAKKINKPNQTQESGENNNIKLKKQKNQTKSAVKDILTEQEKREIQQFLNSMEGTKRWWSRTGEKNEAEEIQEKFEKAGPHIRGSKEIIRKLWSMQYTSYDSWWNYLGVSTFHYNERFLQFATPEILNDKEFMIELIKGHRKLINYLGKCDYYNYNHPLSKKTYKYDNCWNKKQIEGDIPNVSNLLADKKFVLSALDSIKKGKEGVNVSSFWSNMSEEIQENEEIIGKILSIWNYDVAGTIKWYLIKKDSKILDNRELMKKLILLGGGYNRHEYPEKVREDKEYILLIYKKEWLKWFYTFNDESKSFYEAFFQRVKDILVQEGALKEDEEFLKQMYVKRPELEINKPNLDADVLKKFADYYDHKNNVDLKKLRSYKDIVNLMNKYIKRLDISQMGRLIGYLETYAKWALQATAEQCVKKFVEENDIQDIDEKFLALPENDRLLVTWYRHYKNREDTYKEEFNFGCGWHGFFKTPTEHGACITGKKNLTRANLAQLAEYEGDRCYRIPEKIYVEAQNEIVQKNQPDLSQNINTLNISIQGYQSIYKECEERVKKMNALQAIMKENKKVSINDILNIMPEFVEYIMGLKDGCSSIRVDLKNKIWSYIKGYSDYNGSGWSEYGLYIKAWYAGELKSTKVVYRDRYDPSKDDRSLNFDTLDIQDCEIAPDKKQLIINLVAKSDKRTKNYSFTFAIKESDTPQGLNKKEQEKFLETFQTTKEKILLEQKKRYEGLTMPVYCLPSEMTYNNMPWGDVPYQTPKIVQEAIDAKSWLGVIVIYKQIDHCAGTKRQMAREWYLIKQDGTHDRVVYEPLWDSEKIWGRNVSVDAEEILQNCKKK